MKIPVFTTVVLLYTVSILYAQSLSPAALVSESKKQEKRFEPIQLFSLGSIEKNAEQVLTRQVGAHSVLRLESKSLRNLLRDAPAAVALKIPSTIQGDFELELVKVDLFSDDFTVIESARGGPMEAEQSAHYRGIVKGNPSSWAAISVYEGEVMGLISVANAGNLVIGKLQQDNPANLQILYNDQRIFKESDFLCATADDGSGYAPEDLLPSAYRNNSKCVRVYFEVDYDIFQDKGGTAGATNYVTGLFNQAATLFANDNVRVVISQIFVWSNPSPYSGSSSSQLLNQFQQVRTSFNGDLAQLLSYKASGGIAVLNGLCHPSTAAKMSFSSINRSYSNVPTYSFTVMVVTHELGHLLGSHHTHACVWNGNNTAIDGCAGFTEGNCSTPGLPSGGGTIMSYCHISSVGINFNAGFGPQPGNVIRNRIGAASCVQTCSDGGGGGGNGGGDSGGGSGGGGNPTACSQNTVYLRLVLDAYGSETTWRLRNANGQILKSGGPYRKGTAGAQVRDTFCLPNGCYSFEILDSYGDGICCAYGNGAYSLTTADGRTIRTGGSFGASETTNFCLPFSGGGSGGGNASCIQVDFKNYSIQSYGSGQDLGTFQLLNNGSVLRIQNNAWKAIFLNYNVVSSTVLDFEFASTLQGEIHGIGFDNDDVISANRTFKVYGTQAWGIQNYHNYPGGGVWRRYTIPVGQFYTGQFDRLFFVCDNDSGDMQGNSFFRNIRIYNGTTCQSLVDNTPETTFLPPLAEGFFFDNSPLNVFPNPAGQSITLSFLAKENGNANVRVFNMTGQQVLEFPTNVNEGSNQIPLDVSRLPVGGYVLRIDTRVNQLVSKFNVSR